MSDVSSLGNQGDLVAVSSGNVAAGVATATMPATAGKLNYIDGFTVTGSGSTSGLAVSVTVTGLAAGTQTFTFTAPAGVLVPCQPLIVNLPKSLPASGVNVAIAISCPSLGAGSTNSTVTVFGVRV